MLMSDHGHNHHNHNHSYGPRDSQDHGHAHGIGGHLHRPATFGRAFAAGIALNGGFVLAEAVYGVAANSVALLADAGHNLGDVLALAVAWMANFLVGRAPTPRFTYGLRGSSILAALFNSMFLLLTAGAISWEAVLRLSHPAPVAGKTVMIVAAIGVLINSVTALLFASGRKGDINLRGAFIHMASDALIAAGVVIAGLIILLTGWLWLDPLVSLAINALIVWNTWGLLKDSAGMSMAAVPPQINPADVRGFLEQQPGVAGIHDLHIWPMSTTEIALTCHLIMPEGHPGDRFIHHVAEELASKFKISHPTMQIEVDRHAACALAPDSVV